MLEAFNKAYKELQDEGTLAEISIKWFAEERNCQGKLILKRGESKLENIITFLKDIRNYTATLMPQVIVGLKSQH